MDFTLIAGFVAFFGMVLAWLAAPSGVRMPAAVMMETSTAGAD